MKRLLDLDPAPADALDGLWSRSEKLANVIEDALDWIEAEPVDPRAKRRRFSNGMWAISVHGAGEEWLVIWEESDPGHPVVRLIAEATSL